MVHPVLLLGGTSEASQLARRLDGRADVDLVVSLAGRTAHPVPLPGSVRTGGFGGAEGLARYLASHRIAAVIDATHPFAAQMSHHAASACESEGVPRLRLLRPPWAPVPGDVWIEVADLAAAAACLADRGARRVFLTTGRTELRPFAPLPGVWFLVRCVDPPAVMPLGRAEVVLDRGPFDEDAERHLMARCGIDTLVTKNSGGPAGAKLAAARSLSIPVVIVDRPAGPGGPQVASVDEAEAWLDRLYG